MKLNKTLIEEETIMPRISALTLDTATGDAKNTLEAIKGQIGMIPNIYATFAQSPKVLDGYLAFSDALSKGALSAALREQIALATAGANGCDYCASAHTALGKGAGVADDELALNLTGVSNDPKVQAVLAFVRKVVKDRGFVADADVAGLKDAGFGDGEIVEIIANIAANLFTNYFNHIVGTAIDFPPVSTEGVERAA